jgi:hypothetical protein
MTKLARSNNSGRALVAGSVFAAFFWTLALNGSPQLHHRVHADAKRVEHSCAVTLIASGSYEHAAHPPLVSAPQSETGFAETAVLNSVWVQPVFLCAHIFAHGPPVVES